MRRHGSKLISLAAIAALLLVAFSVRQPVSGFAQDSQSKSGGIDNDSVLINVNNSFATFDTLSKDEVERRVALEDSAATAKSTSAASVSVSATPVLAPAIPIPLPGGLDHVAAGTGTRNSGFGTIRLRGAPVGAAVVVAYLFWGTIYPTGGVPATATAVFNGVTVTGLLIGTSTQPCWNAAGTFAAYRAAVPVPAGINGDYRVSGLATSVANGTSPWCPIVSTLPLSEGASLIVVYSHFSVPATAQVVISNGPLFFSGAASITHFLTLPVPAHSILKHTRLGADGQVGTASCGLRSISSITNERTFINLTQIKGNGSPLNQDSDWNGYDSDPLNKLWDTHTDDVIGSVRAGATSYTERYFAQGDCIVAVAHVLGAR